MPFEKGESGNPSGRPTGAQGRLNKTVKETVLAVFNKMQDDPKVDLMAFGKKYPRDFYAIAAKLIPTEIAGSLKIQLEQITGMEVK